MIEDIYIIMVHHDKQNKILFLHSTFWIFSFIEKACKTLYYVI